MLEPIAGTVELKWEVNSCRGWVGVWSDEAGVCRPWAGADTGGREKADPAGGYGECGLGGT
jgi:hypothetical protein